MKARPLYYIVRAAPGWWWVPAWRKWLNGSTLTTGDGRAAKVPRTIQDYAIVRAFEKALRVAMKCPTVTTIERCQNHKTDPSMYRVLRTWTNTPIAVKKTEELE